MGIIVFSIRTKKYLLLKYKIHNQNYWDFPKGKQEKGESLIETAKRELYEEIGV